MKTVYKGKERMKNGLLRSIYEVLREPFVDKLHTHHREIERRKRQLASGVLKPNV